MTEQEKSALLARVCGWTFHPNGKWLHLPGEGLYRQYDYPLNLYDPDNMKLAWRVLNWANKKPLPDSMWPEKPPMGSVALTWGEYIFDELCDEDLEMFSMPLADVQRRFLDMILMLAMEAGMVGNPDYRSWEEIADELLDARHELWRRMAEGEE